MRFENMILGSIRIRDRQEPCLQMSFEIHKQNFISICEMREVGKLSSVMLTRLLKEKIGVENNSILRMKTFLTWLSLSPSKSVNEEERDSYHREQIST